MRIVPEHKFDLEACAALSAADDAFYSIEHASRTISAIYTGVKQNIAGAKYNHHYKRNIDKIKIWIILSFQDSLSICSQVLLSANYISQ